MDEAWWFVAGVWVSLMVWAFWRLLGRHPHEPRFTRADVAEMADLAECWEAEAEYSERFVGGAASRSDNGMWGKNAEGCRRRALLAHSLATRIAATLPPEKDQFNG